ncbi:MAG: antibiotic biosynthesis monooxygenase family protein [Egibacteraceae bacterium]
MAHIDVNQPVATLINVFTVEPENQQRLVDLLVEATESVMCKVPGFVSANIHASLDGTRVVNYAQWSSEEDFAAMLHNPDVHPHFEQVRAIATPERHLYRVSFVQEAPREAPNQQRAARDG